MSNIIFSENIEHHGDASVQSRGFIQGRSDNGVHRHAARVSTHVRNHRQDEGCRESLQDVCRQGLHGRGAGLFQCGN